MIVDTSAVMTILFGERGAERYDTAIAEAPRCRVSVVSFLEAAIVLERRSGTAAGHELDAFLKKRRLSWRRSPLNMRRPRAGPGGGSARAITRRD